MKVIKARDITECKLVECPIISSSQCEEKILTTKDLITGATISAGLSNSIFMIHTSIAMTQLLNANINKSHTSLV